MASSGWSDRDSRTKRGMKRNRSRDVAPGLVLRYSQAETRSAGWGRSEGTSIENTCSTACRRSLAITRPVILRMRGGFDLIAAWLAVRPRRPATRYRFFRLFGQPSIPRLAACGTR